jgi:hypothetical protein
MADIQTIDRESEDLTRRSCAALAERRARGEIMTYVEDGWVFREYPGQRIERLCRLDDFEPDDYKIPG